MKILALLSVSTLACAWLPGAADADVLIQAEVLSSDATSSTVRFTFSGDLAGLAPQVNLKNFLFIDFSSSTALGNGFPAAENIGSFSLNTVSTSSGASLTTMEVRNNEFYYFDRLGFVFDTEFTSDTSFTESSVLEVVIPTSSPITSPDFNNLNVYWSFPNWGTNEGRGTLAGVVNPVAPASIGITQNAEGQLIIEFTGVLQSSPDLATPFTEVPGATSPYLVPPGFPSSYFFRASDD